MNQITPATDSTELAYWEFDAEGRSPKPSLRECPLCPDGGRPYFTRTVNGTNMIYIGCSQCGLELKAALLMVTPTKEQPSKDILTIWNTRPRASVAAPPPEKRHYSCSCGGALTAEEYIEHYFEKGHDRGEQKDS